MNKKTGILSLNLLCAVVFLPVFYGVAAGGGKADLSLEPACSRNSVLVDWEDLKYGMFIHYGMSTFTGAELDRATAPSKTYAPTDLDVRQWVRVAKQAGMKYAVLVTKHMSGHCLWDSEGYDYDAEVYADAEPVHA